MKSNASRIAAVVSLSLLICSSAFARDVTVDARLVQALAVINTGGQHSYSFSKGYFSTQRQDLQEFWSNVSADPDNQAILLVMGPVDGVNRRPQMMLNDSTGKVSQEWVADNFDLLSGLAAHYDVSIWIK